MLTAYIIRNALKAVRTLQAIADGHALFKGEQRVRLGQVETDIANGFDTYAHFLGNKVGPSGYGEKLGVGAEQDVLSIAAIGEARKLIDGGTDDDVDREELAQRTAALDAIQARIIRERMKT